jgi:hypothetical protein
MTQPAAPLDGIAGALDGLRAIAGSAAAQLAANITSSAWQLAEGTPDMYRAAIAAAVCADAARQLRDGGNHLVAATLSVIAGVFGHAFRNGLTLATVQVPDYPPQDHP